jgi:predicted ArsR family transcriptional regulator
MIQRNVELGYGTVTKDAMQDRELTIEAKAIYAYLCSFAGGKDEAWPSVNKMCYDLNISENRLRKHLNLLIEKEYIERYRRRYTNTSQWANNVYIILK